MKGCSGQSQQEGGSKSLCSSGFSVCPESITFALVYTGPQVPVWQRNDFLPEAVQSLLEWQGTGFLNAISWCKYQHGIMLHHKKYLEIKHPTRHKLVKDMAQHNWPINKLGKCVNLPWTCKIPPHTRGGGFRKPLFRKDTTKWKHSEHYLCKRTTENPLSKFQVIPLINHVYEYHCMACSYRYFVLAWVVR